ncbi:MAG TPA: ATP-grasp domain-containing protein [Tepidisphaeraceae bacterium]|jgi:carbamoyl-phosphate synthase large subunit|nr:ATP-grasp domain-containing protein [Tepidisphaeraceae bacterium]
MLSAAGRRVGLMRILHDSLAAMGLTGHVLATDIVADSPAMQLASKSVIVPPYRDPQCLDFLLKLCRDEGVRLIVPTIDPELAFYARHADAFGEAGCKINISHPDTIAIGGDKQMTNDWLRSHAFPTVGQAPLAYALAGNVDFDFPMVVKPRFGSASVGVRIAKSRQQLQACAGETDLLVQSIAAGNEYTTDVFVDTTGRCRCAVPRRRLEIRGGEVSKAMTVRNASVASLARRVAETLPGAYGVMNIQIFHDSKTGELAVIEINPRYGGGHPLAHEAGATMTRWLLEDILQVPSTARDDGWRDNWVMLRYDEAVYVDRQTAGIG